MFTVNTTPGPPSASGDASEPSQIRTREELGAALTALRVSAGLSVRDVTRLVPSLSLGTASGWFSGQHVPTRSSEATLVTLLELLGAADDLDEWRATVERVRSRPGPRRSTRRVPSGDNPGEPGARRSAGIPDADPDDNANGLTAGTGVPAGVPAEVRTGTAAGMRAGVRAGARAGVRSGVRAADPDSPYVGLRPYDAVDAPLFHGRAPEIDLILRRAAGGRTRLLLVVGASGSGKSSLLAAGVPRGGPAAARPWSWCDRTRWTPMRPGPPST